MPIVFQLQERLGGFSLTVGTPGGMVLVSTSELVGPADASHLVQRLEGFEAPLFRRIPGLPPRSQIDHLVVVIKPDLSGVAYVNELSVRAEVKVTRAVNAGSPVFLSDIGDIASIDLGIDIPTDAGVVVVRSHDWKRSLFYDLRPLLPGAAPRSFPIDQALAQQMLLLLGLAIPSPMTPEANTTRLERNANGVKRLRALLDASVQIEAQYQELLEEHPWMLGGIYSSIERHLALDDGNIPDFTAVRCHDGFRDIIELKHPFISCFRQDGDFASAFNEAWNQAERYLSFTQRQRAYLSDAKGLRFENPLVILLLGYRLTDAELQRIRIKEGHSRIVKVLTYDHLLTTAEHLLALMSSAGDRVFPTPDAKDDARENGAI